MRRPTLALALAFFGTALAAPTVFAQQSAPSGATTPTGDPGTPIPPGRSPQSLLRNGLDFITYQEYERALTFLREAERRQKELTETERLKLKQGLDRAQRGLREASVGMSTERSYARSGRTPRPGAMAFANPAASAPAPAIEREPIQLVGGQTSSDPNPNAANIRASMPAPGVVPDGPAPLPSAPNVESAAPPQVASLPKPSSTPAPLPEPMTPAPLPELPAPDAAASATTPPPIPTQIPLPEPAAARPSPSSVPATGAKLAAEETPLPALPTDLTNEPTPAAPAAPAVARPLAPPVAERPLPDLSERPAAPPALPMPNRDPAPSTAPAVDSLPALPDTLTEPAAPAPAPAPAPAAASSTPIPMPGAAPEASAPVSVPAPELPAASSGTASAPESPSPTVPATVPATVPVPVPAPEPPPAAAAPDSPPASEAPPAAEMPPAPIRTARDSFIPVRSDSPPSSLSPELRREVERIGRLFEEEMQRNPVQTTPPVTVDEPGTPGTPASTRLEISRAPSPTEARPIRAIPVPEEFVLLPKREWDPNRKYWAAAATCHFPLYFQDASLERYGYSVEQHFGPLGRCMTVPLDDPRQSKQRNQIAQPFFSAGLFCFQIAALPYNLLMDPPWESEYDLGYYRPGDRVPTDVYYLPLTGIGPPLHGNHYDSPSPGPSRW